MGFKKNKILCLRDHSVNKSIITKMKSKDILKKALKMYNWQASFHLHIVYIPFTVESRYLPLTTSKNWGSLKEQKNTVQLRVFYQYIRTNVEMYVGEMYGPMTIQISKDDSGYFTDGSPFNPLGEAFWKAVHVVLESKEKKYL